jgi:N6-L-threonylcarbamoyladenine synthase
VGITYAKALAFANGLPLIAVNHLEGHIHAVLLNEREATEHGIGNVVSQVSNTRPGATALADEPALALVVSGGHTHLYLARPSASAWTYRLIGRTLDDAAGEAFDKVAKLLGLGYPGGPWIDSLALHGNARAVPFAFSQIKTKVHLAGKAPRTKAARTTPIAHLDPRFLFSFSGIKTAVLRYVELHNLRPEAESRREALFTGPDAPALPTVEGALAQCDPQTLDLIASFQYAVVGDLMKKTFAAAESLGVRRILVTGGVAANRSLRNRFTAEAARRNVHVAFPTLALSTDNAAMIAAAAWPKLQAKEFADPDLSADPSLALGG